MKTKTAILIFATTFFFACTQKENKRKDHHHASKDNQLAQNAMMKAMDESMKAMHNAKQTGNPDFDFASMMIPHHEGALVMAEALLKDGKSPKLISFAKDVIVAQQKEISMLKAFLKTANQQPTKDSALFKKSLNSSMQPMMDGMGKVKLTNNADKDFVALMIPHHQSAVDMAKAYLPYSNNAHIKLIAEQILKAQEKEIKFLQGML